MAAILDLVNFHRFEELEKNAILFFLIPTMFQIGINKKITFNKHFARKYIREYTTLARLVITPVRHAHTRLHTPLLNICSSPSSIQHTRGLTFPVCLLPQPYPQCSVLRSDL